MDDEQQEDEPGPGRPTKFTRWVKSEITRLAPLGLTNKQLAAVLHVSDDSVYHWQREYPEFFKQLTRSKRNANKQVAASLFAAAMGYSHPEDKIFVDKGQTIIVPTIKHYPPDIKAAALYLKNRDPENWRDKQEVEHTGGIVVQVVNYADSAAAQLSAAALPDTAVEGD